MATYPTPAQIDAAVPVDGKPSRALTNTALKNIVGAASYLPTDGSVPTRSVANADFSGGRLKAAPATDPDDCVTKVQFDQLKWGAIPDQPAVVAYGTTQAEARASIGAGTSNLTIGTTADTAATGDHRHDNATATTDGFMSKEDKVSLADAALKSKQNTFTDTTTSTSTTTGAAVFSGGVGVQGAVHSGATPDWLAANTQVAPMVFIRDMYRQQVEAGSGGMQTVLYTAKGQPSIMNVIPAFNLEDIDASLGVGVHPAFIVGGVQKSEIFIGAHIGSVSDNELISRPGVDPAHSRNHDQFVTLARACGAGWHVMTNAEWSAIALWSYKNGFLPRGNTNYGRSREATHETARRVDGGVPGADTGAARTLTGSGPAGWRHDNTPNGIADMSGNVSEWTPGLRLVDGEIQIIPDNNAALTATDLSAGSTAWRAIDGATGDLVAPGHANAVKYAASGTASYTLVCANWASFEGMTNPGSPSVSEAALQKLKAFGLFPAASSGLGGDAFGCDLTGERLPLRGGDWAQWEAAGVFALFVIDPRSYADTYIGSRPAFVL